MSTPLDQDEFNQLMGQADAVLDRTVAALVREWADKGEVQATANVGLALRGFPPDFVRSLAIAAIHRMAWMERS